MPGAASFCLFDGQVAIDFAAGIELAVAGQVEAVGGHIQRGRVDHAAGLSGIEGRAGQGQPS